jgi:two-component system sensor histidine kinase KdpD
VGKRNLSKPAQYAASLSTVVGMALLCYLAKDFMGYRSVALLLLLCVSVLAMFLEIAPVLLAAAASALLYNFVFIPPVFTFRINSAEDLLMFAMYFVVALINAVLTTKIRQAEAKARDKEEKEKTIRLYNTLINSLSHELRTPIATILGAAETLAEGNPQLSEADRQTLLAQIGSAGTRLDRQVGNLLNMSRLETGMLTPKPDWCDVQELMQHVITSEVEPTQSHRLIVESPSALPLFQLDAGLLEQILSNLVHNALAYSPAESPVSIHLQERSGTLVVGVKDRGKGIPEEDLERIFDKFVRLSGTRAGGTGLGLSIVRGFAQAMGGTVKAMRPKDGGAHFEVVIPAKHTYLNQLKHD